MLPNKARGVPVSTVAVSSTALLQPLPLPGRETWSTDSSNRIKQCRRIAARYYNLPANNLAFGKLASIRLWLRLRVHALVINPLRSWEMPAMRTLPHSRRNLLTRWSSHCCRFDSLACQKRLGRAPTEEARMSNALRCRAIAAGYARRAGEASDPAARRTFLRLEALWRDMAPLAEDYDRWSDPGSKERLYQMIDAAAAVRRKVA